MTHIGSIIATSGAIFIVVSLTLVRYRYINGQFALVCCIANYWRSAARPIRHLAI